jgi:mRNA interferase RelE/StbE
MPAYRVEFAPRASRTVEKLEPRVKAQVLAQVAALSLDPRPPGVRKLAGYPNTYRIRLGEYRIVYEVRDDVLVVHVVRVGHRKSIYKGL